MHEAAAAPPRSTVYNVFTEGRARLDTELVRDIVLVLGAAEDDAAQWVERCRSAQRRHAAAQQCSAPASRPVAPGPVSMCEHTGTRRQSLGIIVVVLLLCVCVNVAGNALVRSLGLPVYLDMVGTAIVAIALGPWYGAIVATATALAGTIFMGNDALFALVGIAGALTWGYGVRRFRLGDTFARFLSLSLIVALVCSMVATPLLVLRHGGSYGAGQTNMTGALLAAGAPLLAAVSTVNIITSLIDKLVTGYIALALLPPIGRWFRIPVGHIPLVAQLAGPAADPRAESLGSGRSTGV